MNSLPADGQISLFIAAFIVAGVFLESYYDIRLDRKYHHQGPLSANQHPSRLEMLLMGKNCVYLHQLLSGVSYDNAWLEEGLHKLRDEHDFAGFDLERSSYDAILLGLAEKNRWEDIDALLTAHLAFLMDEDNLSFSNIRDVYGPIKQRVLTLQAVAAKHDVTALRSALAIDTHNKTASRRNTTRAVVTALSSVPIAVMFWIVLFYIPANT